VCIYIKQCILVHVLHAAITLRFTGLYRIMGPQDVTWFMLSLSCLYFWKSVDLCLIFSTLLFHLYDNLQSLKNKYLAKAMQLKTVNRLHASKSYWQWHSSRTKKWVMVICLLNLLNGTFLYTIWKIRTYEAAKLFIQELHTWKNFTRVWGGFKNLIYSTDIFVSGECLTLPDKYACPNDDWFVT